MSGDRPPARRDIRPLVYAAFDFLIALVYAVLLLRVMPAGHAGQSPLLWLMVMCVAVMCGAMFVRNRWGWRVAAGACGLLLLLEVILLVILVMSAAYLSGVFGAFGRGAALMTLLAGFVTIQLIAMLPAFQLKFLMTRAGKRCFGVVSVASVAAPVPKQRKSRRKKAGA